MSIRPPASARCRAVVRLTSLVLALAAGAVVASAASRDEELAAQLREQIATLQKAPPESRGLFGFDSQQVAKRLVVLQKELAVVEKRQELEAKERVLRETMNAEPRAQLRERLQAVPPPDAAGAETRMRELAARRAKALTERETNARRVAELRRTPASAAGAGAAIDTIEAEERLITTEEDLRAIALRAEAAENESDLARLAQSLRDRIRSVEAGLARPSLRLLLTHRALEDDDAKQTDQLSARIANLDATLRNGAAGLDLQQQKLAGFDEEIKLFEQRPAGAARRTPRMEQLLAQDRVFHRMLTERLPIVHDQVEALRRSRELLQSQLDLLAIAARVRAADSVALRNAYLARLRMPALIVGAVVALYLILSRIVYPMRYKKEELFLARRVTFYGAGLLGLIILAIASIDDVRMLATTVGVASAGVVIALQDVATSICGWCVIMMGRKFTIGDRLEIDGARGDVLDIQLLRTTLVELNNWLGVDQPTGRVFIVPNNFVFKSKVFNYSHGHPYIWGVVDVTVTFTTPVASALALFEKVLTEETAESFAEAKTAAREMVRRYGVEDADYRPKVYTRIADSGVTFSLLYVSHYRGSSSMRNRINRRLIAELETHEHIRLAYPTRQVVAATESVGAPTAILGPPVTTPPFSSRFEARSV